MSDKITLQSVAESFARSCDVPRKTAEQLARAFFDTIVDSLSADDAVKINGLGTFRIVEVSSRESINVQNGDRIVIPGYRKLSFTPEEGLVLGGASEEVVSGMEDVDGDQAGSEDDSEEEVADISGILSDASDILADIREGVAPDDMADIVYDAPQVYDLESEETSDTATESVDAGFVSEADEVADEVNAVVAPERVEVPADEFAGIDMLISTPESVEEIRLELEAARADAAQKLLAAKAARMEVLRLECLLDNMEKSMMPESVCEPEEDSVPVSVAEPVKANDEGAVVVELPVADDMQAQEEPEEQVESASEADVANEDIAESVIADAGVEEIDESAGAGDAVADAVADEAEESQGVTDKAAEPEGKHAGALALDRYLADKAKAAPVKAKEEKSYWMYWVAGILLAVVVICGAIIMTKYNSDKEDEGLRQLPVKPKTETLEERKLVRPATLQKVQKSDSAEVKAAVAEESKPKTYILQKGESLTTVAQKFYGTKDYSAIMKLNDFKDVDNIPVGTEIKLP